MQSHFINLVVGLVILSITIVFLYTMDLTKFAVKALIIMFIFNECLPFCFNKT